MPEKGAIKIGPFGSALKKHEYSEAGIRVLGIEDVMPNRLTGKKPQFIPQAKYEQLAQYAVKAGDVLVTNMGTVGRACVVPPDLETSIISSHLIKVSLDEGKVYPPYVCWALNCAPSVVAQIVADSHGAIMAGFNSGLLRHLRIPFPPMAEQRRIAEVLDYAEALRAKRRDSIAQLDTLTHSIFLDMFGDPITNPMAWPRRSISDVGDVITGNTPSRATRTYFGTDIEWIKSDNINTPYYYVTRSSEGLSAAGRAVARIAPAGSVLVTCIAGSPDCIGNAAMTDRDVAFNQQINALVPTDGDAHFLYAQMRVGKRLIQSAATSSMKGMVSKSRFERISLIFPPLDRQRLFANQVLLVETLTATYRASLTKLDALFASLQHRAFRGEL